jgi:Ni,Fe-hydrogenase III large subunit
VKTERRLVTDAEAAELRDEDWFDRDDYGTVVQDLLDTREELLAALERIAGLSAEPSMDAIGGTEMRKLARATLVQVRGEPD